MKEKFHIGCSGYYYAYWKNRFYPAGMQPRDWLLYYSSVFNSVELNGTFYRIPKLTDLKKYATITHPDFEFSVKMNRYITHVKKLTDCRQEVSDFISSLNEGLEKKRACILFQLPPSFVYTQENLQRVLDTVPHEQYNVVEFRHISWWNSTVADELEKAGITFCNIDFPGLDTYLIITTKLFYFRFHGNPLLFKSSYSAAELNLFSKRIPEESKQCYIYFNNTYFEAGYTNAAELKKILQLE
jgi:uncharacterized protein YecE (DUF72 family)